MGKGDIKTRRGKIFNGSYGARRRRKKVGKDIVKATKPGETSRKSK
jgi:ribosomal small subunit protein bTHX